jgi:hypothetical protein
MAIRSSVARIKLSGAGEGIVRIRTADRLALERHLFQRYPNREWGTFFRFGWRRTSWGVAIFFIDGLWPVAGDLDRQTALTTFKDQYTLRAFREAAAIKPLGIGVIHSHPEGFGTSPSPLDDDMDTYFAKELSLRSDGAPYCSLIFQRSESSGLTFSGRIYDRGEWLPVATMFSVGNFVERHRSELVSDNIWESSLTTSTTLRLEAVLGSPSAERLRRATIGVIGCSGSGSPGAHVLARAKVGGFVLVDPQRLDSSNLERLHGSYHRHLDLAELPYKVELVRDLILEVNPQARVTGLIENILHDNVLDELLRCDMTLGCTDTVHGRLAASDLAQHYLLPSLDVGVAMDGRNGTLTEQVVDFTHYHPDLPCALCGKWIDMAQLAYELMSETERAMRQEQARQAEMRGDNPDQYWRGRQRQLHTVGYLTTAAGALAAGYVEGMLTGTFSMPHSAMQFDIGKTRLGCVAPPRVRENACSCGKHVAWGDGARSFRNVGLPEHFGRRALMLFRGSSLSGANP